MRDTSTATTLLPMKKLPGPVAAVVGANMRAFRKNTKGEWIAREANELAAFGWTKTTVSRIENAQRGLTAEELLLLPEILRMATDRPITLRELLGDEITVGKVVIKEGEASVNRDYEPLNVREARAILARHEADQAGAPRTKKAARPKKRPTREGK